MGGGCWTNKAATSYYSSRGFDDVKLCSLNSSSVTQFYTCDHLHESLNPKGVMRECCDSEEHKNTIPIILALDVTGSMGDACAKVAAKLNEVMTALYKKYDDVEFCVMGIGDLAYDDAPIQISQFESDVRILESLDKVYMEHGGGGNDYESYTAAWYMGAYHTKLDCWNRGKKGIIITMGDETLNPYLPESEIKKLTGSEQVGKTETAALYEEANKKFDIYHISINTRTSQYLSNRIDETFGELLGQHLMKGTHEDVPKLITAVVDDVFSKEKTTKKTTKVSKKGEISW